jgi:hypothetical protein
MGWALEIGKRIDCDIKRIKNKQRLLLRVAVDLRSLSPNSLVERFAGEDNLERRMPIAGMGRRAQLGIRMDFVISCRARRVSLEGPTVVGVGLDLGWTSSSQSFPTRKSTIDGLCGEKPIDENRGVVRILFRKEVAALHRLSMCAWSPLPPNAQWPSIFCVESVERTTLGP